MPDLKHHAQVQSTPASGLLAGAPPLGERRRVYLLPGELHASAEPCQISTILGSCVAVCLWDAKLKVGGMNHYLLPAWREGQDSSMRFGDLATRVLLAKLLDFGCRRRNITGKLFGGSAISQPEDRYLVSLGAKNVAAAQLMLKSAGIPIIAQDSGGSCGRKVVFNTDDGSAWSRRV